MMKMKYTFLAAAFASSTLLFSGCIKEKPVEPPKPEPAERVFFMYDNIGGAYFTGNVDAAGEAVAKGALDPEERVVVYHRLSNNIYELVQDDEAPRGFTKKELKKYSGGQAASLSTETISLIVSDVRAFFPEADSWGLAFGSHGKGWVPKVFANTVSRSNGDGQPYESSYDELWTIPDNPLTRYLLFDDSEMIDNSEFVDALDEWSWDFVLFDDCFMASVEAMYEMRHLADYFIASPTEIMINGFPYDGVVSTLFADWNDDLERGLVGVADNFVETYRAGKIRPKLSATVAVIRTSELDALALAVKELRAGGFRYDLNPETEQLQCYEAFRYGSVFYDLNHYMESGVLNRSLLTAFRNQLDRTVVFADHTETFFSNYPIQGIGTDIPVTHYSGLSTFIMPNSVWNGSTNVNTLTSSYRQTEWYKYVYGE
jgi:hypothetical protein